MDLAKILTDHAKWLGTEGGACANLRVADLGGADLRGADLGDADLVGADLRDANLGDADLRDADLRGADLRDADLRGADLRGADLRDADLRDAELGGADLRDAELDGADLRDANLVGAKNIPAIVAARTSIVPAGTLRVWKACAQGVLAELEIPAEARRSNATGRKCRAEYADVLAIHAPQGSDPVTVAHSTFDSKFTYEVGKRVTAETWEEDRWVECGGGIHFFLTREEAEAYQ